VQHTIIKLRAKRLTCFGIECTFNPINDLWDIGEKLKGFVKREVK
jgi:hypothetical protein